jgi:hyperosmotically inducible periplasmic protein
MKNTFLLLYILLFSAGACIGADISTFHAYVDSDLCSRLMLGSITAARISCSQQTHKDGALPVLVRLKDNTVFDVNKQKMLKEHVGKIASVTGEAKAQSGTMKLESLTPEEISSIPPGDPARKLLDVRMFRAPSDKVFEKIRHELAMMPYITTFDFISFNMVGTEVILTGWTVRNTNRSEAYNRVKTIEGVERITNNIDVLPLGSIDNQIRANARAKLQRVLSRYFWGSGSDIKIVVKNGNIILLGTVATKPDSDLATIQSNSVASVFHVFNMLRVESSGYKSTK